MLGAGGGGGGGDARFIDPAITSFLPGRKVWSLSPVSSNLCRSEGSGGGPPLTRASPPPAQAPGGGGREVYLAPSTHKGELQEVVVTAASSGTAGHYPLGLAASHPAAWSLPPPPLLPSHFEGPITDPPPAYSEGQRKILVPPPPPLLDSNSADSRRGGLLNALLDKVRPRDEGNNTIGGNGGGRRSQTTECLAFGLRGDEGRWPQPLLENLDCTGTLRGLTGSRDDMKKGPSPNGGAAEYGQPVQKPYEPPVLGKSSRITPVGQFLLFIYLRTRKILLNTSRQ